MSLIESGLHHDDPALARHVRRLGLNKPRPSSEVAAEARRIVHEGMRPVLSWLATAARKRELEAQWRNSDLSLDDLVTAWSRDTTPQSWTTTCPHTGKVRYRRESEALEVIRVMQRTGRGQGEVAVYWHTDCGAFHFGRTPGRRTGPLRLRDGGAA